MANDSITNVFIGNSYFGTPNFGDDLTLEGFLEFASDVEGVAFTACSAYNRARLRARYPRIFWLDDEVSIRERAIEVTDLWLSIGDTPFQLDSGPWLLDECERARIVCARLKKRMFFLGSGCESHEAAADPRTVALLASAEHVWTRDAHSAELLRPYIEERRLSAGSDLAHGALAIEAPRSIETDVLGLLLAFERRDAFDFAALDAVIAERPQSDVRWLVQEARDFPHTERWILERLSEASRARLRVMDILDGDIGIPRFLDAFGAPETVLTSRYHGALIAAHLGSRIAVVERSQKLVGVAKELDLPTVANVNDRAAIGRAIDGARPASRANLDRAVERARSITSEFFQRIGHGGNRAARP